MSQVAGLVKVVDVGGCKGCPHEQGHTEVDDVVQWISERGGVYVYLQADGGATLDMMTLTRFNKIAIQATAQMAADKEAVGLSRVDTH